MDLRVALSLFGLLFGLLPGGLCQTVSGDSAATCSNSVSDWSNSDFLAWFDTLPKVLKPYRKIFEENAIDGAAFSALTDDELQADFGINNKYHRATILRMRNSPGTCIDLDLLQEQRLTKIQAPQATANEVNFTTPASPLVIDLLQDQDIAIDDFTRLIVAELDGSLHSGIQEVVRLEGVQALSHYIMDKSATVLNAVEHAGALPSGQSAGEVQLVASSSVLDEAKADAREILDAKHSVSASMGAVQSATRDLIVSIQDFGSMAKQPLNQAQREHKKEFLKNSFKNWRATMAEAAENAVVPAERLLQRSKERLMQLQAGGSAVQENIKALTAAAQELSDAHAKRRAIMESSDTKVQLAIQARSSALAPQMSALSADISQLQSNVDRMGQILQSKDKIIEQAEQFAVDANKKKKEWRDWHINRFWADRWGPEMAMYDRQADKNIDAQNKEKARAEKAKELVGQQMKELQKEIESKQVKLADMQVANTTWRQTLESVGLFEAELAVEAVNKQFELSTNVLTQAMQSAGVGNPEVAAQVIGMQHRAQILMSNAASKAQDTAGKLASFASKFDVMIDSIDIHESTANGMKFLASKLAIVQKTLHLVSDTYRQRAELLDDGRTKRQAVQSYLDSEFGSGEERGNLLTG